MEKIPFAIFGDNRFMALSLKRTFLSIPPLKFLFVASEKNVLLESLKMQSVEMLFVYYPFVAQASNNLIEEARALSRYLKIIVILSLHADSDTVISLVDDGANAILPPSFNPQDMINVLSTVMSSDYYYNEIFSSAMMSQLKKQNVFKKNNVKITEKLDERDIKLMNYVYQELTHKEIGDKMGLKPGTVDTYVTRASHKVGAKSAIGLIKFGLKNKLIKKNEQDE
jgi:DNA-binding NarL/FixJ family response regulator